MPLISDSDLTLSAVKEHTALSAGFSKQILDLLPLGVYICNAEGDLVYYNQKAITIWGFDPKEVDLQPGFSGFARMMRPDGSEISRGSLPSSVVLQNGKAIRNFEAEAERTDGTTIHVRINAEPICNAEGGVTGTVNYIQDFTEQKKAEEIFDDKEFRYRQLMDELPMPVYMTDENGVIVYYNNAAEQLWGRKPELGKDRWSGSWKIFKPDGTELPVEQCPMAISLKEKKAVRDLEIIIEQPGGDRRVVLPNPRPLFNRKGALTGAFNMLVDITGISNSNLQLKDSELKYRELSALHELKAFEKARDLEKKIQELRISEQRFQKMVDEVVDYAIILLDQDGIIRNWNRGAEKIKGYKEEEIVGKSFHNFYLPADRESGLPDQLLNRARETGKAVHEGWRMRKDGTAFWGSILLTSLHDSENNIIGFTKVTRDLTERKLAEDRDKEYTRQLEFQNEELEQFAYAATHDMKEPLRKIHFYNSWVLEKSSTKLDEKSTEYLKRSINSVKRMTRLMEDLLTYSRATAQTAAMDDVNLNEVIDEIVQINKDDFAVQDVELKRSRLPVIKGIPFQIGQLFENLIGNSVKYRHPERKCIIEIESKIVSGKGSEGTDPLKRYYRIDVKDNGIGFDDKFSEKIFDVFQRLNNNSDAQGSGIGLAICKKIMQNHRGSIKAKGKKNEGAVFELTIPIPGY